MDELSCNNPCPDGHRTTFQRNHMGKTQGDVSGARFRTNMADTCWQDIVSSVINLYFQVLGKVSKKKASPNVWGIHIFSVHLALPFTLSILERNVDVKETDLINSCVHDVYLCSDGWKCIAAPKYERVPSFSKLFLDRDSYVTLQDSETKSHEHPQNTICSKRFPYSSLQYEVESIIFITCHESKQWCNHGCVCLSGNKS